MPLLPCLLHPLKKNPSGSFLNCMFEHFFSLGKQFQLIQDSDTLLYPSFMRSFTQPKNMMKDKTWSSVSNSTFLFVFNPILPNVFRRVKSLGGGAKRHPLEINKGAPGDLMLLKVILKPIKVMITCKKLDPYLKISTRY